MSKSDPQTDKRANKITPTRYYYTKKYARKLVKKYGVEALRKEFTP
ncbi:hypothetical protein [Vibrio fluvialis]|nr:hypothetical protein [Vibrio fluvialis]ELS8946781.1 hypothetical protein [Vibrio fluvialis]MCG6385167.1 hypothetical protein [Vibrio fluvialis]